MRLNHDKHGTLHEHHESEHTHEHHHEHHHKHDHAHSHEHGHDHAHAKTAHTVGNVLTIRAASGLSGDMMLTGLARMLNASQDDLDAILGALRLPVLTGTVRLEQRSVHEVAGWGCVVELPHEHVHRTLVDMQTLIQASALHDEAKALAIRCFTLLAEAEGTVHQKPTAEVCFHEVGALDSIVDICVVCELFVRLAPVRLVCSPLPMGDGGVHCAHGWLPTPAPAVLELLKDIPVCGFAGHGETVTPTAVALLKALNADFGPWPSMHIAERALVYGTRVFDNAPNGSVWAFGPLR